MRSKTYRVAETIAERLVDADWPSTCLCFDDPQFLPIHARAYVPAEVTDHLVRTYVVCNGRVMNRDYPQDRCSTLWQYNIEVVMMKVLESDPAGTLQPAGFDELDALTTYSEWVQDALSDKRAYSSPLTGMEVSLIEMETIGQPDQQNLTGGVWVSEWSLSVAGKE